MKVSECCNALPWKLEVYDDLGICSECKEHATFLEEEDEEDIIYSRMAYFLRDMLKGDE